MSRRRAPVIHRRPFGDRTWVSTALPPVAVPGCAIAPRGSVPDNWRSYAVGVCVVRGRTVGYTSDAYLGVDGGYCLHHVGGASGDEAKRAALAEHKSKCEGDNKCRTR